MHYDTIIIGAGPAGLFAAQAIGKYKKNVLVLERNAKPGKKLLVSGAGQCNFTHAGDVEELLFSYHEKSKFVKKALMSFDNKKVMSFFEQAGVPYQVMPNQKVFPKSMKSEDILNVLLRACQRNEVEIIYNQCCEEIRVYDGAFTVETASKQRYFADHVVIATGGQSYTHLGSDGKGYEMAKAFGHTIITPRPALTDVRFKQNPYKTISGLSVKDIEVSIWHEGKKVKNYVGDLLFTHKGLSGPAILNSSRWMQPNDELTINFLYPRTYEEIRKQMQETLATRGKEEIQTYLKAYQLPKNLMTLLCRQIELDEHTMCAQISREKREKLVKQLTQCPFTIDALGGFHIAMVTTGGVHLKEVNPTTLESRRQKGLYFIGEVLDVDAETGGYNIQAAFSTAHLCAMHLCKKEDKNKK